MQNETHEFFLTRRQALAGAVAMAASVAAAEAGTADAKSKAVVLVHGAFTDGNSWAEVITRLQAKGYVVTAVQNPLTSLEDDVAATLRVLERQSGSVVLVGHSWGGAVITEAGMASNVSALVYVSALAPDAGESVADLQKHGPAAPGMDGARPGADGMLWFDPERYGSALAADLSSERIALLAATQQPVAMTAFGEKLNRAAWRTKPSYYLLSEQDQALAPQLQQWMAERVKASVTAVPSSHMSLISRADAVVGLIEAAARR